MYNCIPFHLVFKTPTVNCCLQRTKKLWPIQRHLTPPLPTMSLSFSFHCRTRSTQPPKDNSDTRTSFRLHRSLLPCNLPILPSVASSTFPWLLLLFPLPHPTLPLTYWNSSKLYPRYWSIPCEHSPHRPPCQSTNFINLFVLVAPNYTSQPRALPSLLSTTIWISNWRCSKPNPCSSASFMLVFFYKTIY